MLLNDLMLLLIMLIIYDNYHLLDLLKGPGKNKKNFSGGVLVGKNTPKVPKVPSTNQF